MREGDVAGALADFSRVLDLEPGFVDALVNRASLLLELGDQAAAARDVDAGLALDPEQPHLLCLSGALHHEDGHLEEALESLEFVTAIAPGFAPGWAALGAVLFDLGEIDRSVESLQRSLELVDDDDVRSNLEVARAAA